MQMGLSRIPSLRFKCDDCEEYALKQSDCVHVITRGQAKKKNIDQKCRGSADDNTELGESDISSVPSESRNGNVNGGSNFASGSRVNQSTNPGSSIASRGFSLSSRFHNWN